MLALADSPRRGSLDGRGNLSLAALREWTEWFLDICIDQVRFMADLFDLPNLTTRLDRVVRDEPSLDPAAANLLRQAAIRGEIPRGEAAVIMGLKERTARSNLSRLVAMGLLTSDTPKGPVRLAFPVDRLDVLFPSLYLDA
jgi:Fic family protein